MKARLDSNHMHTVQLPNKKHIVLTSNADFLYLNSMLW